MRVNKVAATIDRHFMTALDQAEPQLLGASLKPTIDGRYAASAE
jgi:hypothetical protein